MNTAFIAKTNSDELWDTLYFSGLKFSREKHTVNGQKVYIYSTPLFTLKIVGTKIEIDGKKYNLAEAKKWIINQM